MLDQLDWMTSATKTGAYSKIDNLVKNIAYPDWITDNAQLTNYHKELELQVNRDDYFTMVRNVELFNIHMSWDALVAGPANRLDFNGPPGTTNAWYQPELNSITFPAAILHQPFYDPTWPTAVNFGGMGVVAGHELTHGFDDQGVQWDGTGILSGWMDDTSKVGFTNMANCVVNEYNGFCPLNKTTYGTASCIDGSQTQGENIADNGGIHAAYRAYRNFINLYGPDPQLPDDLLQEFTSDQLFFLSFAQVWCQEPYTDDVEMRQLLVDPHSPSQYRVWGTIQNFAAFKDAFHCPTSAYAPDNHCDYTTALFIAYGEPVVKNELNIETNKQITTNDMNKYNAYKLAVGYYQQSLNASIDPCNDFFEYACGKYDKLVSFHYADANNYVIMATQLNSPAYQSTIKVTLLAQYLGSNFTYSFGGNVASLPNSVQLANALSYLSFSQGIDTLVTPFVDTNWLDPTKGYRMFMDQNTAYMSKTYYPPGAFKTIENNYIDTATYVIGNFTKEQGLTVDPNLRDKVKGLVEFEQMIANTYSTDDGSRRQYKRSWNLMRITDLQSNYSFIDWRTYMKQVPAVAQDVVQNHNFTVSVMEPGQYAKMSKDYATLDATKLVNYFFMRLLLSNAQYLPTYSSSFEGMPEESFALGRQRHRPRIAKGDTLADTQTSCAEMANALMQFANGRVFIDYLYPDEKSKKMIRDTAGGLIRNVINSFQGMVDQLDWMSVDTKRKAYDKTMGIIQNIAFPDWIMNNTQLDAYYQDLFVDHTKDNYYDMWTKLTVFNIMLQYKQLTFATTDRTDFLGQPGTVNAWYQPELNSITFPAGILQPPYFHPQWPASINYGGMGVVAGHELTHGFDDEGVQWGPTGAISFPANDNCTGWMDEFSTAGFNKMAQCVITEYNQFCPLNAKEYTPNCVNGVQTQGENIADNGGIHAAFRAYRTHIALDGPDPLLPDRLFGQFNHDQLFFLNFAQVWCEKRRTDDKLYQQLMVDPHSPSMYRVFGTIQNYPAFRVAFNCPANSTYAPPKHCNVWVPEKEP
ncbi:peptidase family M13 [Necator americanus]|uniref:Peptidase family M13 n=1 Tax=Necator americanus TaxID=51031 RepID=W2TUN1_NECAM|nr:peptidase family M13 [Necator americanus]ETN85800.1 peptidase family M13 [Necator americanus]